MHGVFWWNLSQVFITLSRWQDDILKVMGLKVKVTETIFGGDTDKPIGSLPSNTIYSLLMFSMRNFFMNDATSIYFF